MIRVLSNHIIVAEGEADYNGVSIDEALVRRGPWYVLLRAHDHIWKAHGLTLNVRFEASHQLFLKCHEVAYNAPRRLS